MAYPKKAKGFRTISLIALPALLAGAFACWHHTHNVVTVVNKSGQTINQVTINVNDISYPQGNIENGQSANASVPERGDSDVSRSYISSGGKQKRWEASDIGNKEYNIRLVIRPDGSLEAWMRLGS